MKSEFHSTEVVEGYGVLVMSHESSLALSGSHGRAMFRTAKEARIFKGELSEHLSCQLKIVKVKAEYRYNI